MPQVDFQLHCADGTRLFAREWRADNRAAVKAVVGVVHGMGEHLGRYGHVAEMLNEAGYDACAYDQRGHGHTPGQRGHTPSYEALLEGVDLLLAHMDRSFPGAPKFLYGHSMGGNVVLNYALRKQPDIVGLIASGPWLKLAFKPPAVQTMLARVVERLYPGYANDRPLKPENLTGDAGMLARLKNDPLRHGRITARFYMEIQRAGLWAIAHADELRFPTLVLHAAEDIITSARASELFAQSAGALCQWQAWPGFRHELHNETGRERVFAVMVDWLDTRLAQSAL